MARPDATARPRPGPALPFMAGLLFGSATAAVLMAHFVAGVLPGSAPVGAYVAEAPPPGEAAVQDEIRSLDARLDSLRRAMGELSREVGSLESTIRLRR